ncbi:Hemicentin-2 [Acropora cervicornis]|uniref:Soluble interferon alpha/beta receptor OPG204 n=1 Tax=Acropora cervicornis TaxID=6130 RepID=A0AAD9PTZ4_ACRCE|nr:Hemicentin-2 [Acropora cervicornis]
MAKDSDTNLGFIIVIGLIQLLVCKRLSLPLSVGFESLCRTAISARIQADPISISLSTGVNVTLDCLVQNGVPADSIHWFKNGQPISISEDSSSKLHERARVVLRNITQADAGKYECKIVKGEEFDTDVYYLNVKGPPAITQLSDEVGGMENKDLRIPCEANGWPKPKIQWKTEDGVYINDDNNYGIEAHPTLDRVTLLIKAANTDHEGEYFCEASNSYGTVEDSTSSVRWFLTDTRLPTSQSVEFYAKQEHGLMISVLHIQNVSEKDRGLYKCDVSDDRGSACNNVTLIVDEKENLQNISTKWEKVQVSPNGKAHLKCVTSHSPFLVVNYFWLFRGTLLNESGTLLNESGTHFATYTHQFNPTSIWGATEMSLWIKNVSDLNFGKYSCVVNSSVGMSWRTIHLVRVKKGIDYSLRGQPKNERILIILFPLMAGGVLAVIATLFSLRRLQKTRHGHKHAEEINDGEFKYDVFVTFSTKDHQWVSNKLIPVLEARRFKYCIHSRDFELGRTLVDNMAESVYSSRKVVAVVSKNYLESKFCRGELEMALHRSKTGRDGSLFAITIDGIMKKKLPKALRESPVVDYHCDTENSWEKKLLRFLAQHTMNNANMFNTKL